jgi:hypothetical protein
LGELDEDRLGDIFGQHGVADHSQRGGINQINVVLHQSGKGRVRVVLHKFPQ